MLSIHLFEIILLLSDQSMLYNISFQKIIKFSLSMNREIILRVRSPQGQLRITVNAKDTYGQLLLTLSKKLNYLIKDLIVAKEDGKSFITGDGTRLESIPYFQDGAILKVQSKAPKKQAHTGIKVGQLKQQTSKSNCNHPPGGRCLNCISVGDDKKMEEQKEGPKCKHGPGGRCLNCCSEVDLKDKDINAQMLCQHGPNAKCIHCLDKQFISNVAHVSFDNWLQEKKLKCKGVHASDIKCNNCLPPSKVQYEVDTNCKYHEPYPKAMCNKCIPPSAVVKRQIFRHVDYVEFMNIGQIQEFIRYWLPRKHEQQRVAYLYGYYAQDPHYKGGIRVIVEALYEPKQKGSYSGFQILEDQKDTHQVDVLANGLTLERVGWIFTETNHDVVMSEKQVRKAAQLQEKYKVSHSSGYQISNFISVILREDAKNPNEVKPEVYMISDQGQAVENYGLFVDSDSRRKMQVKVKQNPNEAYPTFIVEGKNKTQFQPEFLLVKIAFGSSKTNKFAILKKSEFPPIVRTKPTKKDLKDYLKRNKNVKQSWIKYGDFNFLLYLSNQIDIQTALNIAESVSSEYNVDQVIDQLIQNKADL